MSHLAVQVISQAACSLGQNFLEGGEKELVVLWNRALWCVLLIKLRLKQVPETDSCVYRTNWKQGVWQCRRWECRVLVACREGNWVLCNTLLHFFRACHSFLRSQQWNPETLQWCSEDTPSSRVVPNPLVWVSWGLCAVLCLVPSSWSPVCRLCLWFSDPTAWDTTWTASLNKPK